MDFYSIGVNHEAGPYLRYFPHYTTKNADKKALLFLPFSETGFANSVCNAQNIGKGQGGRGSTLGSPWNASMVDLMSQN